MTATMLRVAYAFRQPRPVLHATLSPSMRALAVRPLLNNTRLLSLSTPSSKPSVTFGILRENYDKWERRAPLTPSQCHDFFLQHPGSNIIVQPSSHRIFNNKAYERAGAVVQEDLSGAQVIFGVKRPRSLEALPPEKTYLFFSHVIKGQPENMGLLQDCLDRKVQLIDYEKIAIVDPASRKEQRLVAFGRFAGLAGTIDSFHILGQRLLWKSWSTPFLNVPPSIYHSSLDEAKRAVTKMGERISAEGLPAGMPPIVYGMTGGPRGNVYQGVREIFDLLPHEMVAIEDLPQIYEEASELHSEHKVYGVAPTMQDLYVRNSTTQIESPPSFDRNDFMQNPHLYHSQFAEKIAPYLTVLVNSIFWDHRFPRLLTKREMAGLYQTGNERLIVVSDISCDLRGSIEFLDRSTTIDRPVFQYDPIIGEEVADTIQDHGVSVFGVDILPTELPRESSQHFGTAVQQIMPDIFRALSSSGTESYLDHTKLSQPLSKALITTLSGELANDFKYLGPIMKRTPRATNLVEEDTRTMIISLEGHLFDSGLINQILDILEIDQCAFEFLNCNVRYRGKGKNPIKSTAILKISTDVEDVDLQKVERQIGALVEAMVTAEATIQRLDRQNGCAIVEADNDKTVLLLGSGRVSRSVVDYLGRNKKRNIIVASNDKEEARGIAALARRGRPAYMDVQNDPSRLQKLVGEADVVISLLPAPMHPNVAEMCIRSRTDLVTASYESNEMRKLGDSAETMGIKILNEVGLDPGLDHMSAMKMIDEIRDRGGHVTSFSSVCGGLPAPEAAFDNPLNYKFSWSPRGVLSASQNSAQYMWEGHIVQVPGNELLANAAPFVEAWPELHLECLPNRDSLHYKTTYGLENVETLFRGTLRYRGYSSLMHIFMTMGFFNSNLSIENIDSWDDVLATLNDAKGGFATIEDFVLACADDDYDEALRARQCLEWLGMMGSEELVRFNEDRSIVDLFCRRLEEKLKYGDTEQDMTFGAEATMTAMCKTVGYPAAMAADLVLGGLDGKTGLLLPTIKEIYQPILKICAKEGINFEEHVKVKQQGSTTRMAE